MTIYLKDIWAVEQVAELEDFKILFARSNGRDQPLDVWARDKKEWQGWQEHRPAKNDFNRTYIFSLMQFYHEHDTWLFGGIFEVKKRLADRYVVELTEHGKKFIGRLKIHSLYKGRAVRVNMENHYKGFEVKEILATPYGRPQ